jgi:predicted nucleotidyltransferase
MRTIEEASTVAAEAQDILAEVKRIVLEVCPSATILLYGSVSRGTQTPESDYDFLILTEQRLSRAEEKELNHRIYDLELQRETILSTICCSREEWDSPVSRGSPFYDEVQRDGILL